MWQHLVHENSPAPRALEDYREAIEIGLGGDWGAAQRHLERSREPLEDADAPEAAAANHNLAALHQESRRLDDAVFHAVRSVFLYNRLQDLGGLYSSLRNLAVIHASRGETHLATAAQHQAARARRELVARGMLDRVEHGSDSRGEKLRMLTLESARSGLGVAKAV
jgi:hypothetical protein